MTVPEFALPCFSRAVLFAVSGVTIPNPTGNAPSFFSVPINVFSAENVPLFVKTVCIY